MSSNPDLTAVIDGDVKGLEAALRDATDAMKQFESGTGASLRSLDDAFKSVFGHIGETISATRAALATAAPVAIFSLLHSEIQKGIDEFKKIGDEADKAAVSTEFFQVLGYQANAANVESKKVTDGLRTFATELGKLKADQGDLKKNLEGTNEALLAQLRGATTAEAGIRVMADAIAKLKSPYDQAKLASDAFGKSNADIARVLNEGAAGFQRAGEEAKSYNAIVDESVIRHSQDIKNGFAQLANVIDLQFKQALLNISPVIREISRDLLGLSGTVRQAFDAFQGLAGVSDAGLEARIQSIAKTLEATQARMRQLQSGKEGTFDHTIWEDIFGSESKAEEYDRLAKKAAEDLEVLNKLLAERDARAGASRTAPLPEVDSKDPDDNTKKLAEGQRALDDLMKRYLTDTHDTMGAIIAEENKERDHFKQLLEEKKISEAQYAVAIVTIEADAQAKIKNAQDKTNELLRGSMQTLEGEFMKVFENMQSGHKQSMFQIERDFAQTIERMVLKAAILEPLFGNGKTTGPGANQFGLIGGGLNSLFGSIFGNQNGGTGSSPVTFESLGKMFSGIFHDGGEVGSGGFGRWVNPGVFAGAHRYHEGGIAGLLPGEVPAILQQGETVIPKDGSMPAGMGAAGHTFIFQTPDPGSFKESSGQIAAMISQAVSRGNRNL
jgi:hypothetical protein